MPKNPTDHQPEPQAHPTQPPQGYFVPVAPPYESDEIDIFEYWNILVHYKWTILITTVLMTVLATAVAFKMTPKYQAGVLMAPITEEKRAGALSGLMNQFGGLASLAGIGGAGGGEGSEALATLKSRKFTEKFINDYKLLPVLFHKKWDEEKEGRSSGDVDKIPTIRDAYKLFNNVIRGISIDNKTGFITLSIVWTDRVQAAQWANMLVQRVNRTLRDRAIAEAERSLDYLNKELAKTSIVELQQVIYRLIEGQTNTIMLANVREEYAFKVIDPAVVPDENEFVKPKRKSIIVMGTFGGLIVACLLVVMLNLSAKRSLKTGSANTR